MKFIEAIFDGHKLDEVSVFHLVARQPVSGRGDITSKVMDLLLIRSHHTSDSRCEERTRLVGRGREKRLGGLRREIIGRINRYKLGF